jgi:hypothetical protein
MFLDGENETNVPEKATPPEPAQTEENASAGGNQASPAASSGELPEETSVSQPGPSLVPTPPASVLEAGDPVKVWGDPEHKTFRAGKVTSVHEGAHAYDVELDDGTVAKINADGLEYDDRA